MKILLYLDPTVQTAIAYDCDLVAEEVAVKVAAFLSLHPDADILFVRATHSPTLWRLRWHSVEETLGIVEHEVAVFVKEQLLSVPSPAVYPYDLLKNVTLNDAGLVNTTRFFDTIVEQTIRPKDDHEDFLL